MPGALQAAWADTERPAWPRTHRPARTARWSDQGRIVATRRTVPRRGPLQPEPQGAIKTPELAKKAGVGRAAVWQAIQTGVLATERTLGGTTPLVTQAEAERWLKERRPRGRPKGE
jgi:predicted DNA-binding transcriptional regulator AlpA